MALRDTLQTCREYGIPAALYLMPESEEFRSWYPQAMAAEIDCFVRELAAEFGVPLIDARTWWAIGNFREGQLSHIRPGMRADVYVLSRPNVRFSGIVDSIGFGVTPDPDVIGKLGPGLPDVQRTLNWVHLASRYPVRVRVENPSPESFRIGESAVITIRGN